MVKLTAPKPQQSVPDWRGKVYDATTHQWVDASPPAPAESAPAPAPVSEQE